MTSICVQRGSHVIGIWPQRISIGKAGSVIARRLPCWTMESADITGLLKLITERTNEHGRHCSYSYWAAYPYCAVSDREGLIMKYINNKTYNTYTVLFEAIDATNSVAEENKVVVVYENEQGTYFVREKEEFLEKFSPEH